MYFQCTGEPGGNSCYLGVHISRVGDPEKEAYFVTNKNLTVIWILNDQNSSKWSLEEYIVVGTLCRHSGYRDSILQPDIN